MHPGLGKARLPLSAALALALAAPLAGADRTSESGTAYYGLIFPGGLIVYYDTKGPMSIIPDTPKDLPPGAQSAGQVYGQSCQHGLSIPILSQLGGRAASVAGALGSGGYEKALEDIRAARPELKGLYDLRVDTREFSVLGLYRKFCVEVTARGWK